uniref:Uncharacterized protein n=1 Tax=Burkholderia cenocepacia TaxID=95486 RepID=A0A071M8K2_9BURK
MVHHRERVFSAEQQRDRAPLLAYNSEAGNYLQGVRSKSLKNIDTQEPTLIKTWLCWSLSHDG